MADKRITDLPELIQADSGDFIPIVDSSANITKKVPAEKVLPNGSVVAELIPDRAIPGEKVNIVPQTDSNSGSGGGTWTYWSMGGVKFASIISSSRSMSGGVTTSSTFVPPSGFFSSIVNVQATVMEMTSDARQIASVNAASTTSIQVSSWSTGSSGSVTGKVSLTVIGT